MDANKVVFILYKYSIVVKGMERRLAESGFDVIEIIETFEKIMKHVSDTRLFILYLPEDILEDRSKKRKLNNIVDQLRLSESNVLILGEPEFQVSLYLSHPELKDYNWIDRPIETEKFCKMVTEMFVNADGNIEKKKILIVDDDPSYAGMVRSWIKDEFRVNVVTGGMQAITFLLKNSVDLILLDYEMPVVDGPQVFQMLRQEQTTAEIPIVFLTGVSTKEGVSKVMELKPDGYILKSATKGDLLLYLKKKLQPAES